MAESCRDTSHGRMEIQKQTVIRTALQHHQHNNSWLQFAISDKVIILSSHYIHYTTNISIFSSACAIELENHVVVTGGILFLSAIPTVQVYNISGPRFVLPNLQTSRYNHACAYYLDSKGRVVSICMYCYILLVTAGNLFSLHHHSVPHHVHCKLCCHD